MDKVTPKRKQLPIKIEEFEIDKSFSRICLLEFFEGFLIMLLENGQVFRC